MLKTTTNREKHVAPKVFMATLLSESSDVHVFWNRDIMFSTKTQESRFREQSSSCEGSPIFVIVSSVFACTYTHLHAVLSDVVS